MIEYTFYRGGDKMKISVEEKLKNLILTRYKSVREFTQIIDMPYSTFNTIILRGIENANVTNVIKICKELGISADALADGHIAPINHNLTGETLDVEHVINEIKGKILSADKIVLRGKPIDRAGRLLIADYLDVSIELAARHLNGERLSKFAEELSKKP